MASFLSEQEWPLSDYRVFFKKKGVRRLDGSGVSAEIGVCGCSSAPFDKRQALAEEVAQLNPHGIIDYGSGYLGQLVASLKKGSPKEVCVIDPLYGRKTELEASLKNHLGELGLFPEQWSFFSSLPKAKEQLSLSEGKRVLLQMVDPVPMPQLCSKEEAPNMLIWSKEKLEGFGRQNTPEGQMRAVEVARKIEAYVAFSGGQFLIAAAVVEQRKRMEDAIQKLWSNHQENGALTEDFVQALEKELGGHVLAGYEMIHAFDDLVHFCRQNKAEGCELQVRELWEGRIYRGRQRESYYLMFLKCAWLFLNSAHPFEVFGFFIKLLKMDPERAEQCLREIPNALMVVDERRG